MGESMKTLILFLVALLAFSPMQVEAKKKRSINLTPKLSKAVRKVSIQSLHSLQKYMARHKKMESVIKEMFPNKSAKRKKLLAKIGKMKVPTMSRLSNGVKVFYSKGSDTFRVSKIPGVLRINGKLSPIRQTFEKTLDEIIGKNRKASLVDLMIPQALANPVIWATRAFTKALFGYTALGAASGVVASCVQVIGPERECGEDIKLGVGYGSVVGATAGTFVGDWTAASILVDYGRLPPGTESVAAPIAGPLAIGGILVAGGMVAAWVGEKLWTANGVLVECDSEGKFSLYLKENGAKKSEKSLMHGLGQTVSISGERVGIGVESFQKYFQEKLEEKNPSVKVEPVYTKLLAQKTVNEIRSISSHCKSNPGTTTSRNFEAQEELQGRIPGKTGSVE